jgi:hypothetical protein
MSHCLFWIFGAAWSKFGMSCQDCGGNRQISRLTDRRIGGLADRRIGGLA